MGEEILAGPPDRRDWLALAAPLALVAVVVAAATGASGVPSVARAGAAAGLYAGTTAVLFLPALGLALLATRFRGWRWAALFGCVCAVHLALQLAPRVPWLGRPSWNWQGKVLGVAGAIAYLAAVRSLTFEEVGLTSRLKPGWWKIVAAALALLLGIWSLGSGGSPRRDAETVLFQATLPGLDEEIMVRGLLLALLTRAFGSWHRGRLMAVGWPALLTCLLFGLLHVVEASGQGVTLRWGRMGTAVVGLLYWAVRERTGSVWPAVAVHNVTNLLAICA